MKKNKITMQELEILLNREFLNLTSDSEITNDLHEKLATRNFSIKARLQNWMIFGLALILAAGSFMLVQQPMHQSTTIKSSLREGSSNDIANRQTTSYQIGKFDFKKSETPDRSLIQQKQPEKDPHKSVQELSFKNDSIDLNESELATSDSVKHLELRQNQMIISSEDFPKLTEQEIRKNEKEKKNIIKIAAHVAKDKTGSVIKIPDSKDGSIKNFFLEGGEVTNREYRVFLFDLLIQGKKEEFLKAKPYQDRWINAEGQPTFDYLAKEYFSDRKYDYYPVVNISLEGAEMYCRWIQSEVDKLRLKDDRINSIEVRLPYEFEWMYAAKSGRSVAAYPWPIDSIQNRSNCFMANFCAQKLKNEFRYPIDYGRHQIDLSCYTTAGVFLRKHELATIEVWSYNPNAFGLFCMSGNVSEMVYKDDHSGIKAVGGNWASDYKHLRLDSEDEFENKFEPSPKIGFRVCVILK